MKIETVKDLLVDHLRDLYDAEKLLVKTLPKIAKTANTAELQEAIQNHLEETKNHVTRLEQVFEHLETPAKSKPCQGMRGLLEEGKEVMAENASDACLDLGIIAAAQKVEHYEISAYGTARAMAEQIGDEDVVSLLEATLKEEKEADSKLTEIAATVMEEASSDGAGGDVEEEEVAARPMGQRTGDGQKPARR